MTEQKINFRDMTDEQFKANADAVIDEVRRRSSAEDCNRNIKEILRTPEARFVVALIAGLLHSGQFDLMPEAPNPVADDVAEVERCVGVAEMIVWRAFKPPATA